MDVYLNEHACWQNIPAAVWDFTIGGYQVIKKLLLYRERGLLGRDLSVEEARSVTVMIRRLSTLVRLQPELDDNYRVVCASVYAWPDGAIYAAAKRSQGRYLFVMPTERKVGLIRAKVKPKTCCFC